MSIDPYYIQDMGKVKSQLSLPLNHLGNCMGTLNLYSQKAHFFDEFKARNLQFLANEVTAIFLRKRAAQQINEVVAPLNVFEGKRLVLEQVVKTISQFFMSDYVGIWELEQENSYRLNCKTKALEESMSDFNISLLKGNQRIHEINQLINFDKAATQAVFPCFIDCMQAAKFEMMIVAPIRLGGRNRGFIQIFSKRKIEQLFPEDKVFLSQVARKCTLATDASEVFDLFAGAAKILAEEKIEAVYQWIVDKANNIFEASSCVLVLADDWVSYNLSKAYIGGKLEKNISQETALEEKTYENAIDIISVSYTHLTLPTILLV